MVAEKPPYCPPTDTEATSNSFETVTERQKLCIDSFLSKEVRDMMKSIDLP